jgi:hypothetical protein
MAQVKGMVQQSMDAVLAHLTPMLHEIHQNQVSATTRAHQLEEDQNRQRLEAAHTSALAESQRVATAAAVEQTRVSAALPSRQLGQAQDVRLRGGKERMEPRLAYIKRLQDQGGSELTPAEVQGLVELLALGHQVPPHLSVSNPLSNPLSVWGVEGVGQRDRSAPGLFAHLQDHGLAGPSAGEEALHAIKKTFKLSGETEAKKVFAVKSYPEFVEFMRKAKVTTQEAFEKDSDSFWQMMWHSQSVQHLYCEWGWETASVYHKAVMGAWQEGNLHLPSMVDTEECRRGDVGGAMHQRFFNVALQTTGAKPRAADKKAGATGKSIYCSHCAKKTTHSAKDCNKRKALGLPIKP